MLFKTISIIGLGYIGLPTAAMFASKNRNVIGVDVDMNAVDTINAGKIHIVEPKLDILVKKAVEDGFLKAVAIPEPADAFVIAVPTPFLSENKTVSIPKPDLQYIESVSKSIAKVLKKGDLIVLESTSPVGTTEKMADWLSKERPDLTFPNTHGEESDIRIAYCPERVLPGQVVNELVSNDRIIGGMTNKCSIEAINLYKIFVEGECIVTNSKTAEMTKLTENASRDVAIAFANELSIISDALDINVWELISLANRHPRVNILQPGPGVGGHCIAVDPWFIASSTPKESPLIQTARQVNDSKPDWVIKKIMEKISNLLKLNPNKEISELTVACFGLAFKADIDDLRESPAMYIVKKLIELKGPKIIAVEPNIEKVSDDIELVSTSFALSSADIFILLVDHSEFKNIDLTGKIILDTRGAWLTKTQNHA